ncbi:MULTISPECIES: hypothetical protein [Microbacterium]|uniref:hypothetical protein n=1 Tax=Microbacterium TaxID=33882 RepID=UPI00278392A3|nr:MULTISPECIES: hypothetical protein [Microbacterium]MDQ1076379.1 hypothetical protein [Microbacterium sp. SORGH_AS_0969]MDQ1116616.1 hypothetical protein [Microbacterium testaceum]
MRRLPVTLVTIAATAALLSACTGAPAAGDAPTGNAAAASVGPPPATESNLGSEPTPTPASTPDAASIAQADAWLGAIALPAGAVRTDDNTRLYTSFAGWICAPIAGRHGEWLVPNTGVDETIEWIRDNPPAGLKATTGGGSFGDAPPPTSATVAFTPEDLSQQGVLFRVDRRGSSVAVQADVVALGSTSVCPTPDPGTSFGLPGQG